jgi:hypothetical protein
MQNIKNFMEATPNAELQKRFCSNKYGNTPLFLQSEDGQDWYECQSLFADDTIKIMYDSNNIIRSIVDKPVPQRGYTYAVSMFFPINMSVAEVLPETYPNDCDINGSWKFDGETIYQDLDVVKKNVIEINKFRQHNLITKAVNTIAMINASKESGNVRDADADNLTMTQMFLDAIRDVDLSVESPTWPKIPLFIP